MTAHNQPFRLSGAWCHWKAAPSLAHEPLSWLKVSLVTLLPCPGEPFVFISQPCSTELRNQVISYLIHLYSYLQDGKKKTSGCIHQKRWVPEGTIMPAVIQDPRTRTICHLKAMTCWEPMKSTHKNSIESSWLRRSMFKMLLLVICL